MKLLNCLGNNHQTGELPSEEPYEALESRDYVEVVEEKWFDSQPLGIEVRGFMEGEEAAECARNRDYEKYTVAPEKVRMSTKDGQVQMSFRQTIFRWGSEVEGPLPIDKMLEDSREPEIKDEEEVERRLQELEEEVGL